MTETKAETSVHLHRVALKFSDVPDPVGISNNLSIGLPKLEVDVQRRTTKLERDELNTKCSLRLIFVDPLGDQWTVTIERSAPL
jgi:hypothetical protein